MLIYPNPGVVPTKPAPVSGESIEMRLEGLPSFKESKRSIRNPRHPRHEAFMRLREAAIAEMDGRECYSGPIGTVFLLNAPYLERDLLDYMAGIADTLDGSHGPTFTYLPIVYQDDCQICDMRNRYIQSAETFYSVKIIFLSAICSEIAECDWEDDHRSA